MFDTDGRPSFAPGSVDHSVECTWSVENELGVEEVFFGSDDGFVYQMEKGDSFDGALMEYYFRLPFAHLKYPRHVKRWFKAVLDVDAVIAPVLQWAIEFDYASNKKAPAQTQDYGENIYTGGGIWGQAVWGAFIWGAQIVGQATAKLWGSGVNMSLLVRGESNYEPVHSIFGVSYHYSIRRIKK